MTDLVHISIGNAAITALLGYAVVFFGLILLLGVILLMGKIMTRKAAKAQPAAVVPAPAPVKAAPAPGTAGELKLYDTDPRDAAMVMAIIADTLGKPLNELRFISIREVKDDEV
ncbi:MAG: OadG family protein [Oscillospiraceae bacterium]|nr:OadG family protein [Oscillospiraceae bacterium]